MSVQSRTEVNGRAEKRRDAVSEHTSRLWRAGARRWLGAVIPGVALAAAIVAAAFVVRRLPGLSLLSPMIVSIVLGIAVHNLVGTPAAARAGVLFAMRRLLRLGIVLLGLQLTAAQVVAVGASGIAIIVASLAATFLVTVRLGRLLGVDRRLAELIAAGTSICGASAVIATNTVTEAPEEDVAYAVACVTIFGSIAMLAYPLLPGLLALSPHAFGLWAGSSIHEIAQVVAAAFQDGQQAGELGTIAKLSRVMLLAPTVLALGLVAARRRGPAAGRAKAPVPWFVLAFVALVGVNSVIAVPAAAKDVLALVTAVLLSMALAAMGLETDIAKLRAKGLKPLALGLMASLFIAGLSLTLVKLIGPA